MNHSMIYIEEKGQIVVVGGEVMGEEGMEMSGSCE
jgi:hypothetical protein